MASAPQGPPGTGTPFTQAASGTQCLWHRPAPQARAWVPLVTPVAGRAPPLAPPAPKSSPDSGFSLKLIFHIHLGPGWGWGHTQFLCVPPAPAPFLRCPSPTELAAWWAQLGSAHWGKDPPCGSSDGRGAAVQAAGACTLEYVYTPSPQCPAAPSQPLGLAQTTCHWPHGPPSSVVPP